MQRFVDAQGQVYETVCPELKAGHKRSHWMWFIFPQIAGLGRSETARHYELLGIAEARAYLAHSLVSSQLLECCAILTEIKELSTSAIFGYPDDVKTAFLTDAVCTGCVRTANIRCLPNAIFLGTARCGHAQATLIMRSTYRCDAMSSSKYPRPPPRPAR